MIQVSNEYLELMKKEINNIEHKYTIKNITRDLDLTDLLIDDTLNISRFLRTAQGNISPNTLNLTLEARADAPQDNLIIQFHRKYKEFKNMRWKDIIYLEMLDEYLVKDGDLIVIEDTFNNEKITIFTGNVKGVVKTDTYIGRQVKLTVDDNTIKGYNYKFIENKAFENMYIYNSKDKQNSLLYKLCTEYLEFEDSKLMIQDIKDSNNKLIKIPLVKIEKDKKIMEEIAEIIRSIYGNIYTMPNGNLKINSFFDKSYLRKYDITIGNKKGNYPVLEFIENSEIVPDFNKVEVKYKNTIAKELQTVFSLGGQNATQENANVVIKANSVGEEWWKISFDDVIEINKTPNIQAYRLVKKQGSKEYIEQTVNYSEFEIEWKDNFARVRFNNSQNFDIYLKTFSFQGKPVETYIDNAITYTEMPNLQEKNTNIKQVQYKYIVSKEQATDIAKHTYYNECRRYNKVKLRTNNMPFLELEDIIKLDFKKYNGDYQIIAITQNNMYTELVLKLYRDYEANPENIITEITSSNIENGINSKVQITKEEKDKIHETEQKLKRLEQDIESLNTTTASYGEKIKANDTNINTNKSNISKVQNQIQTEIRQALNTIQPIVDDYNLRNNPTKELILRLLRDTRDSKIIDYIFKNSTTVNMIINNNDVVRAMSTNQAVLNYMYERKTRVQGYRSTPDTSIILDISPNNYYAVGTWAEAESKGAKMEVWNNYRNNKFAYFKAYPKVVDYIKNDKKAEDYVDVYILKKFQYTKENIKNWFQNSRNMLLQNMLETSVEARRILAKDNELLVLLSKNNVVLEYMYSNRVFMQGAKKVAQGGKYILLEVSANNSYNDGQYGTTRNNGQVVGTWSDTKSKFAYFKKYPVALDYIRNDTESDDWVQYYDLRV